MAVVAFDPLEYAQQLEAAGMPRAQAEVVAKGLTTMFIHNFDALVTKDYLDTRFLEFESRMDLRFAKMQSRVDLHFADMESRVDQRFAEMESRMDQCFAEMVSRMDQRFAEMESRTEMRFTDMGSRTDSRFASMETRIARVNVMLGVILAALAIPVLQTVLVWLK